MTKLLFVCGYPTTGKTTLASELSKELGIACFHKDTVKEVLFDILKCNTIKKSKQAGQLSMKIIYKLAEEQLSYGVSLIIDSPLYFKEDYKLFSKWEKKYNLAVYKVICMIDQNSRKERYFKRMQKAHPYHFYKEREKDFLYYRKVDYSVYNYMPGKAINVIINKQPLVLQNMLQEK